ncbi:Uncharacterized protein C17G6.02c [Grifola frondosa]|uniref:Uncharacterized protein C17G6.02c n=1 Tax=Grifola frondosa TaxID=5627 RepID=A0A1C7MQN0_GRIFR|nr:Uncharacterized protein C17G6.02c [Grifola frondosa]
MPGLNSTDPSSYRDSSGHIISPYYGYLPTRSVCMMFVALFGISTITHVVQATWTRKWWLLYTVCLAGSGEILGWSGRLWSSYSTLNQNPYLIQIVVTILAPTPLVAALFIIFSRITERMGTCYSRLSPRWYSRIFLTCDIIALFVQATGGGIAASSNTNSLSKLGSNIMLAGIVFQLVSLSIFSLFMAEYYFRYIHDRPVRSSDADSLSTVISFGPGREPLDLRLKLMIGGCAQVHSSCLSVPYTGRLNSPTVLVAALSRRKCTSTFSTEQWFFLRFGR